MIKILKIKMYMLKTLDIRVQYWRNNIWLTLNLRTYETNMIVLFNRYMKLESFNFSLWKLKKFRYIRKIKIF